MSIHFKTIPPVLLIPKETQCYLCMGQEKEEPGEKRWANHRSITDKIGCAFSAHVPCMENFIAARSGADPASELLCACTRPIVKFNGEYVGSLYSHLKDAVGDKNEPLIQEIFTELATKKNYDRLCSIWIKAAENNDKDVLRKLLDSPLATSNNLRLAFNGVGLFGHIDCLEMLLEKKEITPECTSQAVIGAAANGHTACLEMLLRDSISEEARGKAAIRAAVNGHTACLEMLLRDSISEKARGEAAIAAATHGHTACLEMLLRDSISEEARGKAVIGAAANGHTACLEMLLTDSISEEARGEAAIAAATHGHTKCLEMVLANGPILDKERGGAAERAARKGHTDCLRILLASGLITEEARGWAAEGAASNGRHTDCLQMVLENGPIPENLRIIALLHSIRNNNESCLRLLLPGREELGTVGNGIQNYLRVLLQKKQLSSKEQGAFLKGAAIQGDLASVTELCQQESILQEDFNFALGSCEDPDCMRFLLQNRFITEKGIKYGLFRLWMIKNDWSEQQKTCMKLLLEHKQCSQEDAMSILVTAARHPTGSNLYFLKENLNLPIGIWKTALSETLAYEARFPFEETIASTRISNTIAELEGKRPARGAVGPTYLPFDEEPPSRSLWVKVACAVGAVAILHGLWVSYTNQAADQV